MTITITNNTNIEALVEEVLQGYPMSSIVYEVIDNELHYEIHPHQMGVAW